MKIRHHLYFIILIYSGFILFSGCGSHNINFVVSDDASIQRLNEMAQGRTIQATTKDSIYSGNNIIIKNDTTVVENISTAPRVIPYSSMKSIKYTTERPPLDGIIELKNKHQIQAKNIFIANIDTVIRFDEVTTTSVVFPTKDLVKIQKRDHLHSTLKGLGYGITIGAGAGAILGSFVGDTGGSPPPELANAPVGSNYEGTPRPVIFIFSTIVCGISGAIVGSVTGAILGQWEDINIIFSDNRGIVK